MPKQRKVGLQKKVSSIFTGVPIPKDNGAQQPSGAPALERSNYAPPSHLSGTTEKPQQPPVQPPPKAAPAKQPKPDVTVKTAKQIPWQQALERIKTKLFTPKPGVSSKRQKTMMILVPLLFLIMIFAFTRVLSSPSPKITGAQSFRPSKAIAGSNNESNNEIDWQIPELYPTTLRDPMQFGSVTTTQDGTGKLIVKGIVYSENNPSAVIGNQIVHEGEKVLGATIVKINKDSVEFEMNGKRWTQKVQR